MFENFLKRPEGKSHPQKGSFRKRERQRRRQREREKKVSKQDSCLSIG